MSLNQKVQGVALLLVKISVSARRREFRKRVERLAFELLELSASRGYENMLKIIAVLEELVEFGRVIYEIEPLNAACLAGELGNLRLAIRQTTGVELLTSIEPLETSTRQANAATFVNAAIENAATQQPRELPELPARGESEESSENDEKTSDRQGEIVEKMRQMGNRPLQVKELLAEFPGVSVRTLRYNLQRLCEGGLMVRIGLGGPGTYYRLK